MFCLLQIFPRSKRVNFIRMLVLSTEIMKTEAESELRQMCSEKLPSYMIPRLWTFMDELPLNQNGKIDRKKLEAQELDDLPLGEDIICSNCLSATCLFSCNSKIDHNLLVFFQKFVAADALQNTFFENGLDSLFFAHLCSFVRIQYDKVLTSRDFAKFDTLSSLACYLFGTSTLDSQRRKSSILERDGQIMRRHSSLTSARVPLAEASSILLTGSTGFVGCYLLMELLANTNAHITCLVRAASDVEV